MRCTQCKNDLPLDAVSTATCPRCGRQLTEGELKLWLDELESTNSFSMPQSFEIIEEEEIIEISDDIPVAEDGSLYDLDEFLEDKEVNTPESPIAAAFDPSKTLPAVTQTVDFSNLPHDSEDFFKIATPPQNINSTPVNQVTLDSASMAAGTLESASRNIARDAGFNFADPNIAASLSGALGRTLDPSSLDDSRKTATEKYTIENATLDSGAWAAQQALIRQSDPKTVVGGKTGGIKTGTGIDDDDEGTFDERRLAATYDSAQISDSQGEQIVGLWRGTIVPTTTPNMTIKRDMDGGSPKDTKLVIKSKSLVQKPLNNPPVKSSADYELLNVIGEGGVGVVYAARQASIDRTVAVKMLKGGNSGNFDQREKFLSEAVVTGDLDHPNIVPIYDLGMNESGALFYSMKKVQGTPWSKVIYKNSLVENLEVLMKVADAVGFAHARGVIHRDLKPENTMLGEYGEVLVMDWGLAMATSGFRKSETITQTSSMGGTPAYMAPEMAAGPMNLVGPASDVYLLGAMLYEILTGNPPHTGKTVMKCLMAAARNEIQATEHTGELIEISLRAMSTRIGNRYQTVKDFQNALREYESHSESITLAARAEDELQSAIANHNCETFARALFAFQEAYALWDNNHRAKQGIINTQLAYAKTAKSQGDLNLANSILSADVPEHAELKAEIAAAVTERDARSQRLRKLKRLTIGMAAAFAVVITGALIFMTIQRAQIVAARDQAESEKKAAESARDEEKLAKEKETKSREEAELAKVAAIKSADEARQAEVEERKAKDQTEKARLAAVESQKFAEEARGAAEKSQKIAELAKLAEVYEGYIAKIGLASAKVTENAFGDVLELLNECPAELRDWEWGRLHYMCGRSEQSFKADALVDSVSVSPNGKMAAAACWDGTVRVWNIDQPKEPKLKLNFGGEYVHSVAFSHNGQLIAVGGNDKKKAHVKIFDAETGKLVREIMGHDDGVLHVVFSKDDSRLLSCGYDNSARIWEVSTGNNERTLRGHSWWVWSAEWSPDEKSVVTASQDGTVVIWNLAEKNLDDPRMRTLFTGHSGPVYSATFSPDGTTIASAGNDHRVLVWDRSEARPFQFNLLTDDAKVAPPKFTTLAGHSAAVRQVRFFKNTSVTTPLRVLSMAHDNTMRIWDAKSGKTIQTLRGHSGWVRGADFLPGEKMLISGSHDKELKLWNLEGYEEFRALKSQILAGEKGHKDALLSASFSSDGKRIVTSSRDRSAKIWNTTDGKLLQTLSEGHEYLVNALALFPDGQRFATAAMDNTTRIWDLTTGSELKQLPQTGQNAIVTISHNGLWLVTAGNGQFAQLWNGESGELMKRLAGHRAEVTAAAFSRDDQFLATADTGGRLRLWKTGSFELVWTHDRHTEAVTDLAFSRDGKWLFSSSGDNTVGCARVRDGIEEPQRNWKHSHGISSMALAANDSVGATLNTLGQVQIWDPATAKSLRTFSDIVGRPSHIDLTADGKKLLVVTSLIKQNAQDVNRNVPAEQKLVDPMQDENREQSMILFFDTATGKEFENERIVGSLMWSAAFMPEGDRVIGVGGNGAKLREIGKPDSLMSFTPHGAVTSAHFSPDGNTVLTGSWDTSTKLWGLEKGHAAHVMPHVHQGPINVSTYSADGKQLLTGSDDATAIIWNVETMQPTKTLRGHTNHVRAGAFLPKSHFAITAGNDGSARIWKTDSGEQLAISPIHPAPITSVDVIEAQQLAGDKTERRFLIVTGCEDNSSRLWTWDGANKEIQPATDANRKPIVLSGHTAAITSVAFSPNGSRILTGSSDASLKLWDSRTGKEILTLNGHSQEVTSVCFSPDGSQVLSASRDGTAIIWLADGWKKN